MAQRSINQLLNGQMIDKTPQEIRRMLDALHEAREVLRYVDESGAVEFDDVSAILKKWGEHG